MANKVKVWTKQHEGILQVLDQTGRFLAQKSYIQQKMKDHAPLYLQNTRSGSPFRKKKGSRTVKGMLF
jgi:hypothetical protein